MATLLTKRSFSIVVFSLLALVALAPSAVFASRYYTDSDHPGYWWGKDPVEEEPEQPTEEKPTPKQQAPKPEKKEEPRKQEAPKYAWQSRPELRYSDFKPQELWDMKPKELSELFDAFKDQSVWQPSEAHVRDMYMVLRVVRSKAAAFTNVQQMVVNKEPALSMAQDYPTAAPGKEAVKEVRQQEIRQRVASAANEYGLVYFYKPGCPYCEAQQKILKYFIASRGFSVQPVNILERPDVAGQFNITITPSLVMIKRGNGRPLPISYGIISLEELEQRVFSGVRDLDGETSPEQYGVADYEKGGAFDPTAPLR